MVDVSVSVSNIGGIGGKEVVQLYINDTVSSVTTPVKVLKGFEKVYLQPGETKKVSFELDNEDLSFLGRDMQWTVEPGVFEL